MVWPKFKLPTCGLKFDTLPTQGKFKLLTCGLKSYDGSVPLNSFLSYLILYFYVFCVFRSETHQSRAKLYN